MTRFELGVQIKLTGTFRDALNVLVTPSTVEITIKYPDGTIATETPTNPSTGVYEYLLTTSQVGIHYYRYEASGTIETAKEGSFAVNSSNVIS